MSIDVPRIAQYVAKKEIKDQQGNRHPLIEREYILIPYSGDTAYGDNQNIIFRPILPSNALRCVVGHASFGSFYATITIGVGSNTTSINLDGSSNCFIKKITETASGGTLTDFMNCNVYIPMVYDLTVSAVDRMSYFSVFGNSSVSSNNNINGSQQFTFYDTGEAYTGLGAITHVNDANPSVAPTTVGGIATDHTSATTVMNSMADAVIMLQRTIPTCYNSRLGYKFAPGGSASFAWLIPSFIGAFGSDKLVPLSECAEGYEMNLLLDDGGVCLVNYPGSVLTAKSVFSLSKLRLHLAVVEYA